MTFFVYCFICFCFNFVVQIMPEENGVNHHMDMNAHVEIEKDLTFHIPPKVKKRIKNFNLFTT